VLLYYFFR